MLHSGKVKPCPPGPAPCVCPVYVVEELWLDVGRKLVRCVEKQRKLSLRCSSPRYFVPVSFAFSAEVEEMGLGEYGKGKNSSAEIS